MVEIVEDYPYDFGSMEEYLEAIGVEPAEDRYAQERQDPDYLAVLPQAERILRRAGESMEWEAPIDVDIASWVTHKNPLIRNLGRAVLTYRFDEVEDAESLLRRLILDDEDLDVRREAILTLKFNFKKLKDGEQLVDRLSADEEAEMRKTGWELFGENIEDFDDPVSWVREHMNDESEDVQRTSAGVIADDLYRVFPIDEVMATFWSEGGAYVRQALLYMVSLHKKDLQNPQSWVVKGVKDEDPRVRDAALWVLGKMYYSTPNHRQLVSDALEDDDPGVRWQAQWLVECAILDRNIRVANGTWEEQKRYYHLDYD